MDRASGRNAAPPAFPSVRIPEVGAISLASLGELRDALGTERSNAEHLALQAVELDGRAEDRLADAGALLVPRRAWWPAPWWLTVRLAEAAWLAAVIGLLDRLAAVQPRGSWLARSLSRARTAAADGLRRELVWIARACGDAGASFPDVEPLLLQADELGARAEALDSSAAGVASRLEAWVHEVRQREDAAARFGFDSLLLAADIVTNGLPVVECPFDLGPGEVAHLVAAARLGWTPSGGARGPAADVGIAHTGIRHWVGSFRHGRAPNVALDRAVSGTLVVSSWRLLFAARGEFVVIALDAVLDLDVYDDAIAVSRLGQENRDVFLLAEPRLVAFMVNWAMAGGLVRGGESPETGEPARAAPAIGF